jgi:hypothetical protein
VKPGTERGAHALDVVISERSVDAAESLIASAWHRRGRYQTAAPCTELKTAFQSRQWASRQEEGDSSVDSEQREECPCDAPASPCPFARESGCKYLKA